MAGRIKRFAGSGDAKLTLEHFLLRAQGISLYRRFIRATRDIHNPDARLETIAWIRSDFDRTKLETDLERIKDFLILGQRQLKQLQAPWQLTSAGRGGSGGDYVKLRGRRKVEGINDNANA
ncbi:hypothetical protein K437DRAFT_229769 [Tilletiaria anomala UBC 951]|uniref:LYR motif-containing protein 2 n=1 Tax=Tilletiaria anomala (strain ATCC 24038 / CBS 436.72 / UBC 951) TaxID=1037660 RepID=A0A066V809_TILAU|nr:uncharacterized protein K437DRAFT_229769 [Tilletiaria anomala UBC 951]KDN36418.1 hypothetical protein K437DRAFT_229769 [Tilletiaria anomala UBC 951]